MSSHNDSYVSSGGSPSQHTVQILSDFVLENHSSILLLRPLTPAARSWLEENIGAENGFQPYWPTVVIESRFVEDILLGISASGLEVQS